MTILGIDHIALSCTNVDEGSRVLTDFGFEVKFMGREIPNREAKKPFLRRYEPMHSLAYCRSKSGISIELTQHSSPQKNDVPSPYQVLLSKLPSPTVPATDEDLSLKDVCRAALGCSDPRSGLWLPFCAPFWYDAGDESEAQASVKALIAPVENLERSKSFWTEGLGFEMMGHGTDAKGHNWAILSFRAPVLAWSIYTVLVEWKQEMNPHHLDDTGFPCLALVTSNIIEDLQKATRVGGREPSDCFKLNIGGKMLEIAIFRGPSDELVEFIQLRRS